MSAIDELNKIQAAGTFDWVGSMPLELDEKARVLPGVVMLIPDGSKFVGQSVCMKVRGLGNSNLLIKFYETPAKGIMAVCSVTQMRELETCEGELVKYATMLKDFFKTAVADFEADFVNELVFSWIYIQNRAYMTVTSSRFSIVTTVQNPIWRDILKLYIVSQAGYMSVTLEVDLDAMWNELPAEVQRTRADNDIDVWRAWGEYAAIKCKGTTIKSEDYLNALGNGSRKTLTRLGCCEA